MSQLPEEDQCVLAGLGGVALPAGNSHLARVLAETGLSRVWTANPARLEETLRGLRARGLAESPRPGYWTCSERAQETAARQAFHRGLLGRLHKAAVAGNGYGTVLPDARLRCRAELRLAFLEGDQTRWSALRETFYRHFCHPGRDPLVLISAGPFEPAWFERLAPTAQAQAAQALLLEATLGGRAVPALPGWLEGLAGTPRATPCASTVLLYLALQGRAPEPGWVEFQAEDLRNGCLWLGAAALAALAAGDRARAAAGFQDSLARLRRQARRREPLLPALLEPFHVLALLAGPNGPARAETRIQALEQLPADEPLAPTGPILRRLARDLGGPRNPASHGEAAEPPPRQLRAGTPFLLALELLVGHLAGLPAVPDRLERASRAFRPLPLAWLGRELEELARRSQGQAARPSPLLDLVPRREPWERALEQLRRLGRQEARLREPDRISGSDPHAAG
jgi:hypothetical protein